MLVHISQILHTTTSLRLHSYTSTLLQKQNRMNTFRNEMWTLQKIFEEYYVLKENASIDTPYFLRHTLGEICKNSNQILSNILGVL